MAYTVTMCTVHHVMVGSMLRNIPAEGDIVCGKNNVGMHRLFFSL